MSPLTSGHAHAVCVDQRRPLSGLLCLVLLMLFTCGVWHLTRGLTVWTFEDWRQQQIAEGISAGSRSEREGVHAILAMASHPLGRERSHLSGGLHLHALPAVCRALGSEFQQMQSALRASTGALIKAGAIGLHVL